MRTDELVAMLATGSGPVDPKATGRRFATALGWGMFGTALAMAIALGVRPDVVEAATFPMFWVKLAFPASVAIAALSAAARLARPGVRLGHVPVALIAPLLVVWLLGFVTLLGAAPEERGTLIFADTWMFCLIGISLLSVPVFVAAMWALKGLAPTRPSLAGGAAGLLAGASGATLYALHCPELQPTFLAIWYVLGMLIPTAAGAVLGARLLRW